MGLSNNSIPSKEIASLEIPLDYFKIQNYTSYDINELFILVRNFYKEVINHSKEKKALNLVLLTILFPYIGFFALLSVTYRIFTAAITKKNNEAKLEKKTNIKHVLLKRFLHFSLLTVAYLIILPILVLLLLPSSIFAIIFYSCNSSLVNQAFRFLFGKFPDFEDKKVIITYSSNEKSEHSLQLNFSVNFPRNLTFLSDLFKEINTFNKFISVDNDSLRFSCIVKCDDELKDVSRDLVKLINFSFAQTFSTLNKILESPYGINSREIFQRICDDATKYCEINGISRLLFSRILQVIYVNIINFSEKSILPEDFTEEKLRTILINKEFVANRKQANLDLREENLRRELSKQNLNFNSTEMKIMGNFELKRGDKLPSVEVVNLGKVSEDIERIRELNDGFIKYFNSCCRNELEEFLESLSSKSFNDHDKELRRILINSDMSDSDVINIIKNNPEFEGISSDYQNFNKKTIESHLEKKYLDLFSDRVKGIDKVQPIFSNLFDNLSEIETILNNDDYSYIRNHRDFFDGYKDAVISRLQDIQNVKGIEDSIREITLFKTTLRAHENLLNSSHADLKEISRLLKKLRNNQEKLNEKDNIEKISKRKSSLEKSLQELLNLWDSLSISCFSFHLIIINNNHFAPIHHDILEFSRSKEHNNLDIEKLISWDKKLESELLFARGYNDFFDNVLKIISSVPKNWTLRDYKEQIVFDRTVKYTLIKRKLTDYILTPNPNLEIIKAMLLEAEYKYFLFKSLIKNPIIVLRKECIDFLENVWPGAFKVFVQKILNNLAVKEGEGLPTRMSNAFSAVCGIVASGFKFCSNDNGIEARTFNIMRNIIVQLEIISLFFSKDLVSSFKCFLKVLQADKDIIEEKFMPFVKDTAKNLSDVIKGITVTPVLVEKDCRSV